MLSHIDLKAIAILQFKNEGLLHPTKRNKNKKRTQQQKRKKERKR